MGKGVMVEHVGEIGDALFMEGFMSEEKNFDVDPL